MEAILQDHFLFLLKVSWDKPKDPKDKRDSNEPRDQIDGDLFYTLETIALIHNPTSLNDIQRMRCKHSEYIIERYDFQARTMTIIIIATNARYRLTIISTNSKGNIEDYMRLMLLMQGFQMARVLCSNTSFPSHYIFDILFNLIKNRFNVVLTQNYFAKNQSDNDKDVLNFLSFFLMQFERLTIQFLFDSYCYEFETFFLLSVKKRELIARSRIRLNDFHYNLIEISMSGLGLEDSKFKEFIVPFIALCPNLKKLFLQKNYLTNDSLDRLIKIYGDEYDKTRIENKKITHLDFSYNYIEGKNLLKRLKKIKSLFSSLISLGLRGNMISHHFFNKLFKLQDYGFSFTIDLRDNFYNQKTLLKKFYLRTHDTLSSRFDNKEDVIDDTQSYKNSYLKSVVKYKVFNPEIINKEKNKNEEESLLLSKVFRNQLRLAKKKSEYDIYQAYFKFFFLLDYYFDPILNSFSSVKNKFIKSNSTYLNESLQETAYNQLQKYIDDQQKQKNLTFALSSDRLKDNRMVQMISAITATLELKEKKDDANYFLYPLKEALLMNNDFIYYTKIKKEKVTDIAQSLFSPFKGYPKKKEDFNPNAYYDHMYLFFLFLKHTGINISVPYVTLHKFLSRVKIETFLAIEEKDFSALQKLYCIVFGLQLSIMLKTHHILEHIRLQANEINTGLVALLNLANGKDNSKINSKATKGKYLLHSKTKTAETKRIDQSKNANEINNYLDLFIQEAELINFNSEQVKIAKYLKHLRNNNIRIDIWHYYEELLRQEKLLTYDKCNTENDMQFDDYKNERNMDRLLATTDNTTFKYGNLALHPDILDYLLASEVEKKKYEIDLESCTRLSKNSENSKTIVTTSYGIINISNRITFFMARLGNSPNYQLHHKNSYLKYTRLLWRYYHALDHPQQVIKEKRMNYYKVRKIKESMTDLAIQADLIVDPNLSISEKTAKKRELLKYSPKNVIPIILIKDSPEVNKIAITELSTQLIDYQTSFFKSSPEGENEGLLLLMIKKYIQSFLDFKKKYEPEKKTNNSWKLFNQEILYQLFRFANRNNYEFNESKQTKFSLAWLYIVCFYLDLPENTLNEFKTIIFAINALLDYGEYCQGIIRAIDLPFRYDYPSSCFEMHHRINNKPMKIKVYYYDDIYEEYQIDETTTCATFLKDTIMKESKRLKNSKEKQLHWLYLIEDNSITCIDSSELILELIAKKEEEHFVQSRRSDFSMSKTNINKEDKEMLQDSSYCQEKVDLKWIKFAIKRRIFSPYFYHTKMDIYSCLSEEEINIVFEQISKKFYYDKKLEHYLTRLYPDNHGEHPNTYNKFITDFHLRNEDKQKKFFEGIKEIPALLSTSYVCEIKGTHEHIPSQFIMSLRYTEISISNKYSYTPVFKFSYESIVKCVYIGQETIQIVIVYKEEHETNEQIIKIKMKSSEYKLIIEDILSYCQLYLAANTTSVLTEYKDKGDLKEYDMIYQRPIPYIQISPPNPNNNLIQKELDQMEEIKKNGAKYKEFMKKELEIAGKKRQEEEALAEKIRLEEEAKRKEEEEEAKKKELKIKQLQPAINNYYQNRNPLTGKTREQEAREREMEEEEEEEDEDDDRVVVVQKLNMNPVEEEKKEEINNDDNEDQSAHSNEEDEDNKSPISNIRQSVKKPLPTDNRRASQIGKLEENKQKGDDAAKALQQAFDLMNFSDDDEEEEDDI